MSNPPTTAVPTFYKYEAGSCHVVKSYLPLRTRDASDWNGAGRDFDINSQNQSNTVLSLHMWTPEGRVVTAPQMVSDGTKLPYGQTGNTAVMLFIYFTVTQLTDEFNEENSFKMLL